MLLLKRNAFGVLLWRNNSVNKSGTSFVWWWNLTNENLWSSVWKLRKNWENWEWLLINTCKLSKVVEFMDFKSIPKVCFQTLNLKFMDLKSFTKYLIQTVDLKSMDFKFIGISNPWISNSLSNSNPCVDLKHRNFKSVDFKLPVVFGCLNSAWISNTPKSLTNQGTSFVGNCWGFQITLQHPLFDKSTHSKSAPWSFSPLALSLSHNSISVSLTIALSISLSFDLSLDVSFIRSLFFVNRKYQRPNLETKGLLAIQSSRRWRSWWGTKPKEKDASTSFLPYCLLSDFRFWSFFFNLITLNSQVFYLLFSMRLQFDHLKKT